MQLTGGEELGTDIFVIQFLTGHPSPSIRSTPHGVFRQRPEVALDHLQWTPSTALDRP